MNLVTMMQLLKRVYLVGGGGFGYSDPRDCHVYLIDGGGELAIIDSGGGETERLLRNIQNLGFSTRQIKYLINTHCHFDHIGGNKNIKEASGCKIALHVEEAQIAEKLEPEHALLDMAKEWGLSFEPAKVDIALKGGDTLKIGVCNLKVIHTPGHSSGSICILMEEDGKRMLFTGDTVLAQGRLSFINGPGFDLTAYKLSMKKLVKLNVDSIFPGHGTFVLSDAQEHVKLYSAKIHAPWINVVTTIDFLRYPRN